MKSRSRSRRRGLGWARLLIVLEVIALAWGAMSFGAVYFWGYVPLGIGCAAIGLLAFVVTHERSSTRALALAMGGIAVWIGFQLVPIPATVIARFMPARDLFLKQYDVVYAVKGSAAWHAVSLYPHATWVAFGCFAAFGLLALGTARLLSATGAAPLVRGVMIFGFVLAIVAIVQDVKLTGHTGEGHLVYILGFWPDPYVNKPFGPFINKNNFAGWMLMALPLTLGYLVARLRVSVGAPGQDWRERILSLSTVHGAEFMVAALASLAMGVALLLSMSRSGMIAGAAALLGTAWFARREGRGTSTRAVRVALVAVFILILVGWVGTDSIGRRFSEGTGATMAGRVGAWHDAMRIVSDFPVVGTGVNGFASAMLIYQQSDKYNSWREAHNDYIQVLAEGGIVLAMITLVTLAIVIILVRARLAEEGPPNASFWIRTGAIGGLVAIGLQEFVEFSLQIPGNAALFAAILGIALHVRPRSRREESRDTVPSATPGAIRRRRSHAVAQSPRAANSPGATIPGAGSTPTR